MKRFVSLQFLNPKTVGRSSWTGDQPIARPLPIQTQNKHGHPCLEWDSKPTISEFKRAKTVHALDRAAIVIGVLFYSRPILFPTSSGIISKDYICRIVLEMKHADGQTDIPDYVLILFPPVEIRTIHCFYINRT
jgi:hypothetical protein